MAKRVALALGGGGTKGIAHLGVLRALQRHKYSLGGIAGTSIGGLVGAVVATGLDLETILQRIEGVPQASLFRRGREIDNALLGLEGVTQILLELIGDRRFNELPIPLALTAVDLQTGEELVLQEGSVVDAVLATIALPGIFPPRSIAGRLLIDGGVSNPVPVALARKISRGLPVVASVLSMPPAPERTLPVTSILPPMPLVGRLSQFRLARALGVFLQAMNINGRVLTELRLEFEQPSLVIRPDVDDLGLLDPVDVEDLVRRGEAAAEAVVGSKLGRALERAKAWLRRRVE